MPTLRQTCFGVEFVAALEPGSVSLLADTADFLIDGSQTSASPPKV